MFKMILNTVQNHTVSQYLFTHITISIDHFVFFQRYPTDKAYFIAKEILATERTYLKDLEVITVVSGFSFL